MYSAMNPAAAAAAAAAARHPVSPALPVYFASLCYVPVFFSFYLCNNQRPRAFFFVEGPATAWTAVQIYHQRIV